MIFPYNFLQHNYFKYQIYAFHEYLSITNPTYNWASIKDSKQMSELTLPVAVKPTLRLRLAALPGLGRSVLSLTVLRSVLAVILVEYAQHDTRVFPGEIILLGTSFEIQNVTKKEVSQCL